MDAQQTFTNCGIYVQTHEGLLPPFVNVGLHVVDPEGSDVLRAL